MTTLPRLVTESSDLLVCSRIAAAGRPFEPFQLERFTKLIEAGRLRVWVDEAEAGFVTLGGTGREQRVLRVVVHPRSRRLGLGRALFGHALAQSPAGCTVLSRVPRNDAGSGLFALAMGLRLDPARGQSDCSYGRRLGDFTPTWRVPPTVTLQPLTQAWTPDLLALVEEAAEELPWDHNLHDADQPIITTLAGELSFAAWEGDWPIGITLARMEGDLPHVLVTYVEPGSRGIGVGRALKEASLTAMQAAGHTHVISECAADNHTIRRLNERLGFEETTLTAWTVEKS